MNAFLTGVVFVLVSVAALGDLLPEFDLQAQVDNARARFDNDFLMGVWYRSNEAIVESREKLLRLYTHYTVQQAEQVIDHLGKYRNYTLAESADKRDKVLARKNVTNTLATLDCIFKYEDSTIQAYKMTGYNLHNCIRLAQIETESKYLEVLRNFEQIKNASLEHHEYYSNKVDNCLDKMCVIAELVRSVVQYERLQEDIATNVTEINGLNTRYLMAHIALGCVSNSIVQIEENYRIGRGLVNDCFENGGVTQQQQAGDDAGEVMVAEE